MAKKLTKQQKKFKRAFAATKRKGLKPFTRAFGQEMRRQLKK